MEFSFSRIYSENSRNKDQEKKQKPGFFKLWALYNASILNKRVVSSVYSAVSFRLFCAYQWWAEVGATCIFSPALVLVHRQCLTC